MVNKDLTTASCYRYTKPDEAKKIRSWWQHGARLLKLSVTPSLLAKINTIIDKPVQDGMIIVMDPLGKLMMVYDNGFDPYSIKDLTKLLRVSPIG